MPVFEIVLLALGLSMDSFAVSISSGVVLKGFRWRQALKIALFLALFQAAMPLLGWMMGREFRSVIELYDHWVAFGVLLLLGGKMIVEGLKREKGECVCFDPCNNRTLTGLSLATSIDALAVGVSLSFLNVKMGMPTLLIGTITFCCSLAGIFIGSRFGKRLRSG